MAYLIVGERPVLVDGVDAGDDRADGFTFKNSFLLAFREERNLVVDVLEDDEDRGLAGQLLGSVVLKIKKIVKL